MKKYNVQELNHETLLELKNGDTIFNNETKGGRISEHIQESVDFGTWGIRHVFILNNNKKIIVER